MIKDVLVRTVMKDVLGTIGVGVLVAASTIALCVLISNYAERKECATLANDIRIFEACYPQLGCMASYSEVVELNRRMAACAQEKVGAP